MHRKRGLSRRCLLGSLAVVWPGLSFAALTRTPYSSSLVQPLEHIACALRVSLLRSYAGASVTARPRLSELGALRREQLEARLDDLIRNPAHIDALCSTIDDELARGDVVMTDNWIVARTEGDICYMLALVHDRIGRATGTSSC